MKPIDDSRTGAMKAKLFQSFKLGAKHFKLKEGVTSSLPSLINRDDSEKLAEKEDCPALEFDLEDDDSDFSDDSFSDSGVEYGFRVVAEKEQQNALVSGAPTTTIQQEESNGICPEHLHTELTSQTSLGESSGESSCEGENNEISEETQVRVENLPLTMASHELAKLFHRAGAVKKTEIMYADPLPGGFRTSRGFGYVTMGTIEEADKAVHLYNGSYLEGNAILVKRIKLSQDEMLSEIVNGLLKRLKGLFNDHGISLAGSSDEWENDETSEGERENDEIYEETQVCVRNLPCNVNSQDLTELFHRAGEVKKTEIMHDDPSLGRFGIVTMSSIEEADKAVHLFNGSYLGKTAITVNRLGLKTYYICVDNLSHKVDDERLERIFNEHGYKVVSSQIVTDRYTKKPRGFGLVEMTSAVERKDAIATLDRRIVDGRVIRLTTLPLGKELNR